MSVLSPAELYVLVRSYLAQDGADACAVAGALAESGGKTDGKAAGAEDSWGLWQMNRGGGMGTGYSVEQLCDPNFAAAIMVPAYNANYQTGLRNGLAGERLARWTYMATERPDGWIDPENSGLDSAAANRFAMYWNQVTQGASPVARYNPDYGGAMPWQQRNDFTCSICATAWALGSLGFDLTPADLQDPMMEAGLVTAANGLEDGSGAALEAWIQRTYGLKTERSFPASWGWVLDRAGKGPVLLGGNHWDHWVAVRRAINGEVLALANSADQWMGVHQQLPSSRWVELGQFAAIWLPVEDAPVITDETTELRHKIAELESTVGALRADVIRKARIELDTALDSTPLLKAPVQRARDVLASEEPE